MEFTPINGTCSSNFDDWRNSEKLYCKTGGKYHCVPNEKGQYGRICTTPMWIQSNLCPEYNTKANKIDAKLCNFRFGDCPTKNYLSNQAYAYSACYSTKKEIETSTLTKPVSHTTGPNSTGDDNFPVATAVVPVCLVVVICIVLGIIGYRRIQRRRTKRPRSEDEEKGMMIPPEPHKELENRKQDTAFYSHTQAIETAWRQLFDSGALIVIGLPGAGKTRLGIELGNRFRGKLKGKYTDCKILHRLDSLEDEINTNYCTYLLLDDCLDIWNFQQDQSSIEKDLYNLNLIYEIHTKRNKELFIVLTVNTHTWQRYSESIKGLKMCSPDNILELKYDIKDKKEIFKHHIGAGEIRMHSDDGSKGPLTQLDTDECKQLDIGKNQSEKTKQKQENVKEASKGTMVIEDKREGSVKLLDTDDNKTRDIGKTKSEKTKQKQENVKDVTKGTMVIEDKIKGSVKLLDTGDNKKHIGKNKSEKTKQKQLNAENDNRENSNGTMTSEDNSRVSLEQSDTVDHDTYNNGRNESNKTKREPVSEKDGDKGNSGGTQEEIILDETYYDYIRDGKDNTPDIDEKTVEEILHANISTIGFPESCYLFCRDKAYLKTGSKFFEKPVDHLIGRFLGWFKSPDNMEKAHFCTLSYALLHGGIIDVDCMDSDLLTEIGKLCSLEIHNQDLVIKSVQYLAGIYLEKTTKTMFVFQHDTVTYAILRLLYHKNSGLVFSKCDPTILTKFVRQISLKDKTLPSEMIYHIGRKHAEQLAKRLAECATNNVEASIYMQDKQFLKSWKKVKHDGDAEEETAF